MGFNDSIFSSKKGAKASGTCLIPFGLFFAGIGGVITFFILSEFVEEAATYQWTETLCEIRSVEIAVDQSKGNSAFKMEIEFGYLFEGRNYTSKQYTLKEHWTADYEPLALKRKKWLALADGTTCFVNPENPAEAVMKREAITKGLLAFFPLIFVIIGVAIMIGGFASLRKTKAAKKSGKQESISISAAGKDKVGKRVLLLIGTVFTLIGGGLVVPLGIIPAMRMVDSKNWVETPCEVIWSRVLTHRGDDSTTYSVDIFYQYDVADVTHRSNRYGFMTGSSSGRASKIAVVKKFPRGSKQVCFVNPALPEQASLKRGFTPWVLLGFLPLSFFFIGIAMLVSWSRKQKKTSLGIPATGLPMQVSQTGPRILKPGGNRLLGVGGMLLFTLFWNGVVSVLVWKVIDAFKRENPEWFLTIFAIPFVIVGLVLFFVFLYKLLALVNAKPVVTLDRGTPRLGEGVSLSWKIFGNARRISRFEIELWGVESATYRRGTTTVTDNEIFFCRKIVDSADGGDIASGKAHFKLPEDLVPTMNLSNNKIRWKLKVIGDIPFWPDVGDTYDIDVLPPNFS